jgi:hypothetical protein
MPDRVIKRVVQLGKKAKQQRMSTRLQFLNRHKEKFDWDTDEPEETEGLLEAPPATDPPAEIPGVLLESDFTSNNDVIEKDELTDEQLAAAALANANLTPTDAGDEIAGVGLVDLDPPQVQTTRMTGMTRQMKRRRNRMLKKRNA